MMVLQKLLTNGEKLGIFKLKCIKDIEKSCCKTAETQVIDFDYVKEVIIKNFSQGEYRLNQPKSCDALKLLPKLSRIDFIEFKGFEEFKKWNTVTDESIRNQIEKFGLYEKIDDSLFVFKSVLQIDLGLTNEEKAHIKRCEINYIILVDISIQQNPLLNIAANLQILSEVSSLDKKILFLINDEIEKMKKVIVNKPFVKSGAEIDEYYKSLKI